MAGKKILLVEDDNNLREIYGARLQAEGYDVVSAPDGENALAVAVKEKPDLIISDVMMPKVSGFDMLDILRNAPETKDTKIIMMTALSQAEDKARAEKLGADMYLVKSQVTLEDVTKAVHSILDAPSDSDQEADSAAAQEMLSGGSQDQPKPEEKPAEAKVQESAAAESTQEETVKSENIATPSPSPAPVQEPPKAEEPPKAPEPPAPEVPAEKPAAATVAPSGDSTQASSSTGPKPISVNTPSDDTPDSNDSSAVTPSLAQALEDEEKAVQEKIEDFEKTGAETSSVQPTVQEQASTNNSLPEDKNDQTKDEESKPDNLLEEKPVKKVIEPINDLSKGPDINELVAKEEAKEAAENKSTAEANQVIKPQTSSNDSGQTPASTQAPDDELGKISL